MKRLILIIIGLILSFPIYSQQWKTRRFEVWGGLSVFQFFGDIGGAATSNNLYGLKDLKLNSTRPGFNIGVSYRLEDRIYIYGTNSFGVFSATDKNSKNSIRNFAFYSIADEIAVQGVFYLIRENQNYYFDIMRKRGGLKRVNRPISLYVFAGMGGLIYKTIPKDNFIGSSRLDNKQMFTLTIPAGLGAKMAYTSQVSFGVELGARYVFSDKLDGLTTQFSKFNDIYYVLNFKVIYRLQKGKGLKQIFGK